MRDNGYCREYLMSYYRELRWIEANAEKYNVSSYEELCKIRLQSTKPYKISHTKSMYGTFKRFEEDGEFPDRKRHQPLVKKATYHKLSPYYKEIIDLYTEYAQDNVHSENTISKCRSKASCFFFHLQNLGYETLDEVKEKDVLSFFTDKDGENIRSRSYKRDIVMVLKSDLREFSTSAHRVSELLPAIPKRHKNIPFLNEEESTAIHEMLSNDDCPLSLRDRAIGMLLYFTGIRAGDIVDLRLSEIDWRNDIIIRQQRKTGKANTLNIVGWKHGFAMLTEPAIDKRIKKYAIVAHEKCSEVPPDTHAHQFRHAKASHWLEDGMNIAQISFLLGHECLNTTMKYLDVTTEEKVKALATLESEKERNTPKRWKTENISLTAFFRVR